MIHTAMQQGNGSTMPFPIETNGSLRSGKAAHAGLRSSKRLTLLTRFIRHAFGQIRADDHLVHQPTEPGVRPYPTPAFTSKRPILKSTTANLRPNLCPCHRVADRAILLSRASFCGRPSRHWGARHRTAQKTCPEGGQQRGKQRVPFPPDPKLSLFGLALA